MKRRKQKPSSGPSQRQMRMGELVRHAVCDCMMRGEPHHSTLDVHKITVSQVLMSPDLKIARAYISVLGGGDAKDMLVFLNEKKRFFRHHMARNIDTKYTPDIQFFEDDVLDHAMHIDDLLSSERVQRDLQNKSDNE